MNEKPFPLRLSECERQKDVRSFAEEVLRRHGLRFTPTLARHMARNLQWLSDAGWKQVEEHFERVRSLSADISTEARIVAERQAANAVMGRRNGLAGIGPKQARNMWQCLGVTQYETPLDSRVCEWINALPDTFGMEARKLYASVPYHERKMDEIQALCQAAGVLPCLFDAAVFSNADAQEWAEDMVSYGR